MGDQLFNHSDIDALETHNEGNLAVQNRLAVEVASKLRLPSIGGRDYHVPGHAENYATAFTQLVSDMDDLTREIKGGNCHGYLLTQMK